MKEKKLSTTQAQKIKQAHKQLQNAIHLITEATLEDIPLGSEGDVDHWLDDIAEPLDDVSDELETLVEATEKITQCTALHSRVTGRSGRDA
jgi:hypothetical protein